MVSSAATNMDGASPSANLRPGPESTGAFTALAFCAAAITPIRTATIASPTQIASQPSSRGCRAARKAAARALTPISIPPTPGTAVKEPARSMVSRMKRRLSMACACNATGSRDLVRTGTEPMGPIIRPLRQGLQGTLYRKVQGGPLACATTSQTAGRDSITACRWIANENHQDLDRGCKCAHAQL